MLGDVVVATALGENNVGVVRGVSISPIILPTLKCGLCILRLVRYVTFRISFCAGSVSILAAWQNDKANLQTRELRSFAA